MPNSWAFAHFLGVVLDLLLEQRGQDGRRGAGLLQPPQLVDVRRQRAGGDHQRVLQFQSEIGRAQVDAHASTSFESLALVSPLPPVSAAAAAAAAARSTPANCS